MPEHILPGDERERKNMERLTKKNPETNLERLLNFAIAEDKQVVLDYGFEKKPLVQVVAEKAKSMDCDATEQAVMYEGQCMECDCAVALMNMLGIQAAELHARLSLIEDILGNVYDLDRLRELVKADRDGRCVVMPCNVGDSVYEVCGDRIDKYTVIGASVGDQDLCVRDDGVDSYDDALYILAEREDYSCRMRIDVDAIGDESMVYTSHEQAEAALKARDPHD